MKINDFEWDEWNSQHIELGHGIEPEEAEEVFVTAPLFRQTRNGGAWGQMVVLGVKATLYTFEGK